ncbi:hypothetical protein WJX73_008438 [Symbiochloris irregularis]|uniref:Uncharacterized protein n=1 Tax=Symbiochloris irregularis TaxID=706552 RepID=A0AAW1PBL9_9CHLO
MASDGAAQTQGQAAAAELAVSRAKAAAAARAEQQKVKQAAAASAPQQSTEPSQNAAGGNLLASVPHEVASALSKLQRLNLSRNQMQSPGLTALSCLTCLEVLDLNHNRLALLEANNNRIKSVPPAILEGCGRLDLLSLHGNPITLEAFRSTQGFAAYDQRRRAHADKQIDMRIMAPKFDEGADETPWNRWMGAQGQ